MSLRGGSVSSANNTVMVDGMVINGLHGDGAVQTYINDADFQEMTYQTAGIGAERSGGGVTLNMVPKEGGNRFSGTGTASYRPGQLQGDNYSRALQDVGPAARQDRRSGDQPDRPHLRLHRHRRRTDQEGQAVVLRVGRATSQPVNTVPNTFLDDGSQGLDDNYIRQSLVRLTYQMSPRHKFGAYYERVFKWRGHDMSALRGSGNDGRCLDLAELLDDGGEVHRHAEQQAARRRRLLAERRYLPQPVPGERCASNMATYGNLCCGSGMGKGVRSPHRSPVRLQ